MAAYAAAVTERIKIGTAVVVLPFHHPVHVAEDFATVDIMSKGRLLFGVGRGYQVEEFYNWGLDPDESRDRFKESLEMILQAWTGPLEYDGKYYQSTKVNVVPKPVQKPHPPVYVAAVSPETYQWVIQNGYDVMTSFLDPYEKVFNLYKGYHAEAEKVGRTGQLDMPLARFVYVSETTEKAREEAREHLMWFLGTLLSEVMVPPPEVPLPGPSEIYQQLKEKYASITYDEVLAEHAIVGDPDFVTDKLKWVEENTGTKHFMGWTRIGGLKHERVCKSLKMFSEHVMPQFAD